MKQLIVTLSTTDSFMHLHYNAQVWSPMIWIWMCCHSCVQTSLSFCRLEKPQQTDLPKHHVPCAELQVNHHYTNQYTNKLLFSIFFYYLSSIMICTHIYMYICECECMVNKQGKKRIMYRNTAEPSSLHTQMQNNDNIII